ISYGGLYSKTDFGPIRQSFNDPQFMELCDYIRRETPPDAVFLFAKPRLLALATDRAASGYQDPRYPAELDDYCSRIGARYVIVSRSFDRDVRVLQPWLGPDAVEIHRNDEFSLYQRRSR